MRILSRVALLSLTTAAAHAATVVYDFNVSWITANPDGLAERPVIGINNQWPPPRIDVQVGDRLIVNLHNSLGDEDTSLHFHGLFMNGSNHMDGPVMVTQCPIPPGASFTYNFTVDQPGTYWYHSHNKGQYPDGFRGPLVIHDPKAPFEYDEELVLTVSDWYHDRMSLLQPRFMSKYNPTGAEPVPKSALMNDTQNLTMPMVPDRTYLFRIANIGAFAGQYIWVEDHTITVVEMDGVYVHPTETNMVYVAAAQRCSFLLTAKKETSRNFPIIASMDTTLFDTIPDGLNTNVTSYLLYNPTAPLPLPTPLDTLTPLNDALLLPQDNLLTLPSPDQTITLNVTMNNLASGANYAFFNDITYVPPRVPTLYTVLSSPNSSSSQEDLTTNPSIYGTYTHPFILSHNSIVQLVLNNLDSGRHPFHLHGHQFQILHRSAADEGTWSPSSSSSVSSFSTSNPNNSNHTPAPMRRDTLVVEPNGNAVIRFQADNPGVWLFHCHIEWHMISGLAVTFIEAPSVLQQTVKLPADHLAACRDRQDPIPIEGNAAGRGGAKNDADVSQWLVLDGQPSPPKPIPAGFTGGGIAALTMSCFTGILGVAVVAWYGFSEPVGESNSASAAAVKTKSPAAAGESGSESGVYTDVDSAAGKSASVVRVKRGTEAVESEALSFGSEEEAVNGVGMATSKKLKGDGVVVDVDAITRA